METIDVLKLCRGLSAAQYVNWILMNTGSSGQAAGRHLVDIFS